MRIAISGAGVAGPMLAYWLRQSDHDVLLVEQAPELRHGGYIIDFWGVGYDIAERMGVLPRIHELGYHVNELRFVDGDGRKVGGFATDVFARATNGRFTSLQRSALAATIYEQLDEGVETIFGDSLTGIHEDRDGVRLSFEHAPERNADLVIGADGLHSRVRELVFGSDYEVSLGYHVAAFEVDGYEPRDELVYVTHGVPGRQVSRFAMRNGKTMFLYVFRSSFLTTEPADTPDARKGALRSVFADVGWECPRILAAMERVADIYFDRVSQIRIDRWSKGRTALVGDAAACVSLLAGEGTGLAMAEAYVLAGELRQCGNDHASAFARYEDRMMPFLKRKQITAARFASSFAPRTSLGITARNVITRLMRIPAVAEFFVGRDLRDDIELPDYGFRAP